MCAELFMLMSSLDVVTETIANEPKDGPISKSERGAITLLGAGIITYIVVRTVSGMIRF